MLLSSRATWTSLFTLITAACSAPAHDGDALSSASDSIVAVIDTRVADIERSLPRYRVLDRDLLGLSAEGGRLIAFGPEGVIGGGVRKVIATHLGETGRAEQTFYYDANPVESLILVVEKRGYYDRPLSESVSREASEVFYFSDGSLIRWRDTTGRVRGSDEAQARSRAEDLRRESAQLHNCASGLDGPACGPFTVEPQ